MGYTLVDPTIINHPLRCIVTITNHHQPFPCSWTDDSHQLRGMRSNHYPKLVLVSSNRMVDDSPMMVDDHPRRSLEMAVSDPSRNAVAVLVPSNSAP